MGLLGGIGKVFKKVTSFVGKAISGVMKFAQSPLGQLLIGVGLTALTGGAGAPLLGNLLAGSKFANMASMFGSFASKFLGPVTNLLSNSGLQGLLPFVQKALGSGDLLNIAQQLLQARQNTQQPNVDPSAHDIANWNVLQMLAFRHAQQILA